MWQYWLELQEEIQSVADTGYVNLTNHFDCKTYCSKQGGKRPKTMELKLGSVMLLLSCSLQQSLWGILASVPQTTANKCKIR